MLQATYKHPCKDNWPWTVLDTILKMREQFQNHSFRLVCVFLRKNEID